MNLIDRFSFLRRNGNARPNLGRLNSLGFTSAHAFHAEDTLHALTLRVGHRAADMGELQVLLVRHRERTSANLTFRVKRYFVVDETNV